MDVRSKFADRYKKDLSIQNLRAKVARRKSVTQKENRHKEFSKNRGLALGDVNVVREQDLTVVEEGNESYIGKGHENKLANQGHSKEQISDERRAMLQRFKEDKQLRKLKDQREKDSKGIFKCGIYKPETSFLPVLATQTAAKVKQREKPPAPSVTRVTRSTAKTEPVATKTRPQTIPVNVLNRAPIDRGIPKGRGQTSVVKNQKENKVSAIPSTRVTRSHAIAVSKVPTAVKAPLKAAKPQKTIRENSPETLIDEIEPPVIDCVNGQDPEPVLQETCVESEPLPQPDLIDRCVNSERLPFERERKPSFAPQNFVFQPLDGLSTFNFEPMTPNRANAFLTPTFTWSLQKSERNFVVTRERNTEHSKTDLVSPTEASSKTMEVKMELDFNASPQDEEHASNANCAPQTSDARTPPHCEPSTEDNKMTQPEEQPHDVPYFRDILKSEIQKLTLLCSDWDKRIDIDIPEDAKDLIRTTVGQTRLLITERFKQFEGLVDNCEFKRGEKETTCTDLDGFWDMIYFQIEDVKKKFDNLGKLEENSWLQKTVPTKKVVRKKIAPAASVKPYPGDKGRAAAKSRLAAIKAAAKNRVKTEEPSDVGAPVIPMLVDTVVFDAGFFRIESPAKLPGSVNTTTPKSTKKCVQNSVTPIDVAEDLKPEEARSPVMSPVRKVLFGIPEEGSFQEQETDRVAQYPEQTDSDSVPAIVDLTKYLVPAPSVSLGELDSPGLMKCLGLQTSEAPDGSDTLTDLETSAIVDDVFMSSPEKVVQTTEASSLPETAAPGPDDDVKTSDPLFFLGSCSPIMVTQSPMRVRPAAALSDLMTFSPMEK
ncbi:disks large-associated protein 5 [Rhinoderma darwinii]|uniref:disks large-associated protein 5 n=1 Tax=Rhinoderma darwinii TaxID=43563 RepID=UPI003F67CA23